jgi:hypothetical protein
MSEAFDQVGCNGVTDAGKDQRSGRGSGVDRERRLSRSSDDKLEAERGELGGEHGDLFAQALVVTILDQQVSADDPAALVESLLPLLPRVGWQPADENTDAMNPLVRASVRCGQNNARRRSEHQAAEHNG